MIDFEEIGSLLYRVETLQEDSDYDNVKLVMCQFNFLELKKQISIK